jgi:hypothetical protein
LRKPKDNLDKFSELKSKVIKDKLQKLFHDDKKHHEDRKGLHGSAIIVSDEQWCYREAVLSLNHKAAEVNHPDSLLRIFKHGTSVHEKWQDMFQKSILADFVEARCYSELWELLSTPDVIANIDDKQYIVEIKSMNSMSYRKAVKGLGHPSGRKQCILYMYLFGIPDGIVLMENKDTQEFEVDIVEFNEQAYDVVRIFLERLYNSRVSNMKYKKEKLLPERICKSISDNRAKKCNYCNICFNIREGVNK